MSNTLPASLNIIDVLRESDYHSSIIFSYSFDLLFYEHVIWRILKQRGCTNNLVFIDGHSYDRVVAQTANEFVHAGRGYSLIPIFAPSCFHPKLLFFVGESELRILVGSGNANLGGLSLNRELFFDLQFTSDDSRYHPFARGVWQFIRSQISQNSNPFLNKQIEMIESQEPWLLDSADEEAEFTEDNVRVSFVVHRAGETILQQFLKNMSRKEIRELTVLSPFFDKECNAVKTLDHDLDPQKLNIIIQPDTVNLNVAALKDIKTRVLYRAAFGNTKSYLHAKYYHAVSRKSSHLLIGSSNCTNNGLGTLKGKSQNIEACVYIESDNPAYFVDALFLPDILREENLVKPDQVKGIEYQSEEKNKSERVVHLLTLEFSHGRFFVQLSSVQPKTQYSLFVFSADSKVIIEYSNPVTRENRLEFAVGNQWDESCRAGYIVIDNKVRTNTVFLLNVAELQRNSPHPRATKIANIINSMRGESDLIDIAESLGELLFETTEYRVSRVHRRRSASSGAGGQADDQEKDRVISYEEFIKMARIADRSETGLYSGGIEFDPIVTFLLSRFGVISKKVITASVGEDSGDASLYQEEIDSPVEARTEFEGRPMLVRSVMRTMDEQSIRRNRQRLRTLGRKYIAHLDYLTKGDAASQIVPPKRLKLSELAKFYISAVIMNTYAGKPGNENYEEIFEMDGKDNASYVGLMSAIVWKFFCYSNTKEDQYPVIRKIGVEQAVTSLTADLQAFILMAPFYICTLLEFCKRTKNRQRELEIIAFKLYLNLQLDREIFDSAVVEDFFKIYHENAGFRDYVNPLTKARYLSLSGILQRHSILMKQVSQLRTQLNSVDEKYKTRLGFHLPVRRGDFVWVPKCELSLVEYSDASSVSLIDWGVDESTVVKYRQGYVMKVEI